VSKKKYKPDKIEGAPPEVMNDRVMLAISRALADPRRLEVFRRIANTDGTACMDLRECLAMNPATLSHHMKQLETAGLIETRKDGRLVRATLRRKLWKSYLSHLKQIAA
jgi:ArsR family transcriptional regulator